MACSALAGRPNRGLLWPAHLLEVLGSTVRAAESGCVKWLWHRFRPFPSAEVCLTAPLDSQWEAAFSTVPMANRMPNAIHSGRLSAPRGHQ